MSIDLKLDENHDLAFGPDGDILLVDGAESVAQQIEITLLTFLGEWFLDETFGVPYFENILIKSPSRAQIENIIRAKVKDVPFVTSVPTVDIRIENSTRRAQISLPDIETSEGLVSVVVFQQRI